MRECRLCSHSQHVAEILACHVHYCTFPVAKLWIHPACRSTDEWMKKLACVYRVLLIPKDEWSCIICRKMDEAGHNHIKKNNPDSDRDHVFFVCLFLYTKPTFYIHAYITCI